MVRVTNTYYSDSDETLVAFMADKW